MGDIPFEEFTKIRKLEMKDNILSNHDILFLIVFDIICDGR